MAKFDAGQIEKLEYDFTAYGGTAGVIREPNTKDVNKFFKRMKDMMKEVKGLQSIMSNVNLEDESEEAMKKLADATEQMPDVEEFQGKTMELIAELCGAQRYADDHEDEALRGTLNRESGSPPIAELENLPYRVLLQFNQWLMGEIRPKQTTPAGPSSSGGKGKQPSTT